MNIVAIVGRLTKDIEVKKTNTGLSVATFTVAVNRQSKEKKADFLNCVAWRQSADYLGSYAQKGCLVSVNGRLETRSYDNKNGKKVFVTEIIAENVQILESKKEKNNKDSGSFSLDIDNFDDETSSENLPF